MRYYIASGLSVGIDTTTRKVLVVWSDERNGTLVTAPLTPEQVQHLIQELGRQRDALSTLLAGEIKL